MADTLIKNKRFKTGTMVDIHYNPSYETNTIAITDSTLNGVFQITATVEKDMTVEITNQVVEVGDIAAFSFGVGTISSLAATTLVVDFPDSMFPDDDVMRYVGTEFQNVLIFKRSANIMPNMIVGNYSEEVEQATYGYAKVVYNLQSTSMLRLAPVRMVDDGVLSALLVSKGFVLKSCDDTDYEVDTGSWYQDFPLQLSGTSIDPIYRRAYLQKRAYTSRGRRAASTLDFMLIG